MNTIPSLPISGNRKQPMRRTCWLSLLFLIGLCCTLGLLFPTTVEAKDYRVEDIPLVHLQDRTRYVSNPDQILSEQTVRTLDRQLFQLEQQTGIQVLVVAVTGIEGDDCFDFAYRLGEKNGVGQKGRDNGLVILLSTDERCVQFATGYGLEGILPDARCKRIQSRYMLPYFKDNRWDEGMLAGLKAVHSYLDGSMENLGTSEEANDSLWTFLLPVLLFLGLGGGLASYMAWRSSRCPYCKQHRLQRIASRVIGRHQGIKTEEVTYLCGHCGHTVVRRERSQDENYRGPRGGSGPIFMGGGGFGGGGGGFSGGSFGGGSFGGGGAGSRF